MEAFKLTEKYQVTVPKHVRKTLHIGKGDRVAYKVEGDNVTLHKISKPANEYLEYLDTLLVEWSSIEDDEAYNDL